MMIVTISGSDYRMCEERSKNMWANKKRGSYGRGVVNSKGDPRKVERTGTLGEFAFAEIFDKEVDWEYRQGGDEQDFKIGPFKIDVKCSTKGDKAKMCYLTNRHKNGRLAKVGCDIYVCASVLEEDIEGEFARVKLYGWLHRNDLHKFPIRPGARGYVEGEFGWLNWDLEFDKLYPMKDLLECSRILDK